MTAKKTSATSKTTTQKTAAEIKADEIAAMMGDDVDAPEAQKPTPPPAVKAANKPESEVEAEDQESEETEDQTETVAQTDADDDLDTDEDESDDQDDEQEDIPAKAKTSRVVILSKTIHTKDAEGKDVKFIASKDPQDLGEFAEMAIKAGCAKPHKAG